MNIALIAHDAKKELMVQFCIAYCGVLSRHTLCATGTTGKLVSEATGLNITRYMSGAQGGDQERGTGHRNDDGLGYLYQKLKGNQAERGPAAHGQQHKIHAPGFQRCTSERGSAGLVEHQSGK